MALHIVYQDPLYTPTALLEPSTRGYIHIAAEVSPSPIPLQLPARKRTRLLARLSDLASRLEQVDGVECVTIFDALAIAPAGRMPYIRERAGAVRVARFDVVVLVETTSPEAARAVRSAPECVALVEAIRSAATHMHVMVARNAKRIGDVDKTRKGLFLFNYFVADDAQTMLELWDYLAGWYEVETGLDNSTLLTPLDGETSDYLAINNARWDESLPRVMFRQLAKKSFRTYVLANMEANHVGAMPILYRRAPRERRTFKAPPSWIVALGATFAAMVAWRKRRHERQPAAEPEGKGAKRAA